MSKSTSMDDVRASRYTAAHIALIATVLATGAASTLAAAWTGYTLVGGAVPGYIVAAIGGLMAAGFAFAPPLLSEPWGESASGNTKGGILVLAVMMMALDGAFQFNAVRVVADLASEPVNIKATCALIAVFQIASFFLRGLLFTATVERQEDISRQRADEALQEARRAKAEADAAEHQVKLAERRERDRIRRKAKTGDHIKAA